MPKINLGYDEFEIYFLSDDEFWGPIGVDVTDEEKVWIERTMKKFWAVQDFLINKTRNGQN
jgi:hypothetical protein